MANRIITLVIKYNEEKLISIHASEIMEYEITGMYFHAYFNKDMKLANDDMYYYSEYEYSDDEYYLKKFKNFVSDSLIITYQDQNIINKFLGIDTQDLSEMCECEIKNLFEFAKCYRIDVEMNNSGLVECTILGRIICNICNAKKELPMWKSFYNKWEEEEKEPREYPGKIETLTKFPNNPLVVIDVDTTGLDIQKKKLVAIHAVEIVEGKFSGIFFHAFINRRKHNHDFMYYLAQCNYHVETKKKIEIFLNFTKNKTIVSHNIKFDIGFINKTLKELKLKEIEIKSCFCTMAILGKKLPIFGLRFRLKECANFYKVKIIDDDFHKGIVDTVALGRIVCKMLENNDKDFNFYKYLPLNDKIKQVKEITINNDSQDKNIINDESQDKNIINDESQDKNIINDENQTKKNIINDDSQIKQSFKSNIYMPKKAKEDLIQYIKQHAINNNNQIIVKDDTLEKNKNSQQNIINNKNQNDSKKTQYNIEDGQASASRRLRDRKIGVTQKNRLLYIENDDEPKIYVPNEYDSKKKYHLKKCGNMNMLNWREVNKDEFFAKYDMEICSKCAAFFSKRGKRDFVNNLKNKK